MIRRTVAVARLSVLFLVLGAASARAAVSFVFQESSSLPITVFNLTFRVGSADDPKGKEGLAEMTAGLMREGGVKAWGKLPARTRAELEDFLFPYAAEIGVSVHKEQVAFRVATSAADAETVFSVLTQMILAPAFDAGELERLRSEALDALTKQLPREDEEELGKAALEAAMYGHGHPYSHVDTGTVASVKSLTLKDVQAFYKAMFTQKRLTVGVAGVVPKSLVAAAKKSFAKLPAGSSAKAQVPAPPASKLDLLLVKGPFEAVGVHLGEPVPFTRSSPDFPAMYLASAAFGKHRSFVGRLMRVVRELRGINYGTYSYVEEFPGGGHSLVEPTQAARSRQAFTLWGRPATPENGCFLLRQMVYETRRLAETGLTPEEFALGQGHLVGSVPLLGTGLDRRLGYAIDSAFYGVKGDYLSGLQGRIEKLTRESVNATIKKYFHPDAMHVVVVTGDPERFKTEILSESCEIHYPKGITKPDDVVAEDKKIAATKLKLSPELITVVPSEAIFEK